MNLLVETDGEPATSAPAVVGALASFDSEAIEAVDVQSHTVFIGRVKAIKLWQDEFVPLVYHGGRFDTLRDSGQMKGECA